MKPLKGPTGYVARRLAEKAGVLNGLRQHPFADKGPVLKKDKGEKGGSCNRTHCQKPAKDDRDGIRWFNHSTRKYYCAECAWELKEDRFNKQDAQQIWGHDLCTLEE